MNTDISDQIYRQIDVLFRLQLFNRIEKQVVERLLNPDLDSDTWDNVGAPVEQQLYLVNLAMLIQLNKEPARN